MSDITVSSDIHTFMQSANKAAAKQNLDLEAADIKTSYESNSDTNAYTDTEKTKLSNIATGAEVNAVASVNTQTGAVTLDADNIDDTSTTHKFATAAQLTKLDGVESGATADQTGSEIKSAYEGESDTNAFTDAEKTKLSGIETGATADQDLSSYQLQPSEGAFANGDKTKLDGIETGANVTDATNVNAAGATMNTDTDVSGNSWVLDEDSMSSNDATKVPTQQSVKAYVDANTSSGDATSIQGTNVDSSVGSPSDGDILVYRSAGSDFILESKPAAGSNPAASDITDATADGIALITSSDANPFTAADESKLDGIEASATADQTGAEIKTAYEAESDTNAFTDAEKTKLSGIETGATADQDLSSYQLQPSEGAFANGDKTKLDGIEASANVTDTANVTSAGALMDSEVTNLAQVKAFDSSDYATAAQGTKADSAQQPPSEGAFANGDKTKLDGISAGAEVNVNADWNSSSGDSQINNKPTLGTAAATASSDYATAAQGTTADSALQDLADDNTPQLAGNLDVNGNDIVSTSNANIDLAANGTGSVVVRGNDTSGKVVLNCENNSHGVTIKGPPHSAAADYTLTLPNDDGSASQTLTTDGSGNLSWSTPSGSYGNSDVDSHLNTSSASSNQVLSWNGSDYAWTAQSGGGGTGGTSARIISIDAGALVARTTDGAATATEEYGTNDVMSDHFLFDGATEEGVQFRFHMPADWDGNAVNAKFYWDAATGASASDGVTWGIAMQAFQNDDALDNAFGTSVDTDDAVTAVGDLHVTALSSDITITGSPSAGDLVFAEVTRVVGDANDTMTEDAKLVGVTIHYTATAATYDGQLGITIDGAGSAISTGSKGFLRVPYDCTITAAQLLADQSGSIVIDVLKDTYANFPPTDPADSICASALPTLSSSQKSEDTTLTGWTTSVSKGDVLGFVVDSATTVTRVSLSLIVTK